jgi:hypothetical protein
VAITHFLYLVLNCRQRNVEEGIKLLGKQLNINLHPLAHGAIRLEPVEALGTIKPGEHLVVMQAGDDGYQHHGLYLGFRDKVPYVAELTKNDGIQVPRYKAFVEGQDHLYVIPYKEEDDGSRTTAVEIADYFIEHKKYVKKYDLLTWNCECFALMCKTGQYQASTQIKEIFRAIQADLSSKNSVLIGHLSTVIGVVKGISSSSSR